jgi:segregation and condensation protein B
VEVAGGWAFRTAPDLASSFERQESDTAALSRSAMEVLAIIAYHQPATQAEIEEIRGIATSNGILDTLMATGWVRLGGRRQAPGRPLTYATTPAFLEHFGLQSLSDLPDVDELRDLGLLYGAPSGSSLSGPEDALPGCEDG